MAKDRVVCEYYVAHGAECKKGKIAEMNKECTHCDKYKPRKNAKLVNKKKEERYKYYD